MRSDRERLEDILEAARSLRENVAPRLEGLENDEILQLATERLVEIIGEAAASLSDDFRAAHPDVDWRGPAGIRVILAHRYFGIDVDVVREAVVNDVPALAKEVARILGELD